MVESVEAADLFVQQSLFGSDELSEMEDNWNPQKREPPARKAKHLNRGDQFKLDDFLGFEHPDLVAALWNRIVNRSRILSEPFQGIIEIIAYQHFFTWRDHKEYMVKVRVLGTLPYATCLGVDYDGKTDVIEKFRGPLRCSIVANKPTSLNQNRYLKFRKIQRREKPQLLFFDYRHSKFYEDPKKPWIFRSAEAKDEYLAWTAQGDQEGVKSDGNL